MVSASLRGADGDHPSHDRTFEKIENMRSDLVDKAAKIIPDAPTLVNMVSQRVRQLNGGRPPLVQISGRMGQADIALLEIIEGKVRVDTSSEEL